MIFASWVLDEKARAGRLPISASLPKLSGAAILTGDVAARHVRFDREIGSKR
jgi:hypothetical protein